ncbi:MAG: hypothetical protein RL264_2027 [Bacteroidota bacterium]|jgi:hypothetical protein
MSLFDQLLLVSKHEKEKVMTPILELGLNAKVEVDKNIDTDALGTFSGEVERIFSPTETLKQKCLLGKSFHPDVRYFIASEGSFGPHPNIPFVSCDDELVMLYDSQTDDHWIGRHLTTETNFNQLSAKTYSEIKEFAIKIGFPKHGLILKNKLSNQLIKGITSWEELSDAFEKLSSSHQEIIVETDMRALFNPTRMKAIESATKDLVVRLSSFCPECGFPGFHFVKTLSGLPCEWCHRPTKLSKGKVKTCQKCDHSEYEYVPKDQLASPEYCNHCNP